MEVLCSMWNGTPMQLCSLYLCFMKKHHTFVSERPGHGEFGKKSKRNKVLKSELGGLMNNLKLFPFMGMADISEGGDANELESGYYINGNFRNLTNSPFDSGWGGIIVFKINYYTLQIASDMNTKIFKVRQRWYNTWDNWRTLSLT